MMNILTIIGAIKQNDVNIHQVADQVMYAAFREAVDDYIATCNELGREPQRPYRGSFNVRIGRDLHRAAAIAAKRRDMNLNELVKRAIEREVQ